MPASPSSPLPAATLALYEKLVATQPDIERKGKTMPYTSLNGHMFSFLGKDGKLALRLPAEEREAFLKRYRTTLCISHGTVMKEYVVVPGALLKRTAELKKYFAMSVEYIASLKPKATTRKKSAGKKASKKKAVKKKAAARESARKKKTSRKTTRKSATKKKASRKAARKTVRRKKTTRSSSRGSS